MTLFARWRTERDFQRKAEKFVERLLAEPDDEDVRWLAQTATHGDTDHARWELRYARRSVGLITAERDALDDRTGSLVARALDAATTRSILFRCPLQPTGFAFLTHSWRAPKLTRERWETPDGDFPGTRGLSSGPLPRPRASVRCVPTRRNDQA